MRDAIRFPALNNVNDIEGCNMNSVMDKRFVIFDGSLMQGGAERVISILSKKMVENGMRVEILLYHDKPIFYNIDSRIKITTVERETGSNNLIENIIWMRKFFARKADVIISFLAPFNILSILSHIGLKSKIVVADRNDPRYVPSNLFVRKLRNFLYCLADGIVVQTSYNQEYFGKRVRNKSTVIYNPIDLADKAGEAIKTQKRNEIVSVGRLMPQKNQLMLLEAFAQIHTEHPEYKLIIYGEGPSRKDLEKKIGELSLSGCVSLPGTSKKIFDDIAGARIFVLSSDYEGMPNALIEAMCLGLPCISTKVSGATDLIRSGENGILVDVGDLHGLYLAMKSIIEDSELRKKYSNSAVNTNEELDVNIIMKKWLGYLSRFAE